METLSPAMLSSGVVQPIRHDGDPVLRRPSAPVAAGDPALGRDMADLAATLADFRARAGFGRAISAPQIGVGKRLIMMNLGHGPMALINPEIVWQSERRQMVWDDCLSVPDVLVEVERAAAITVEFTDHLGRRFRWADLPADLSELLQHEIDHLDGVLMTDRAGPDANVRPMADRADVLAGSPPDQSSRPEPVLL